MHKVNVLLWVAAHSAHMLRPLLFELREEIYVFSKEEGYKIANESFDKEFLMKLA